MRVLHVIPSIAERHGGPSRAIALMEQALSGAGVEVTTATTDDDGPGGHLRAEACLPEANGATRVYFRKWFDFYQFAPAIVPWLYRHLRNYDVVHIHALFSFTSVTAALMAGWRGVPYIIRPLGTLTLYGRLQRRRRLKKLSLALVEGPVLRSAASVHFTSDMERLEAQEIDPNLSAVVIPLGVSELSNGSALTQIAPNIEDHDIILFISRLHPKKNVEGLLRAFALVSKEHNAQLVVAGDGTPSYVASLKALASELGIDASVSWTGHVSSQPKTALLAAADIFVLPSLSENFGIVAVEAMLAGLPCVLGEDVAVAGEAEAAGACIATRPDPQSIAQALAALLADKGKRDAFGMRARQFAQERYSLDSMAAELIKLYDRVSNHKARASSDAR
jgi:glycosyltransferase involved in cell wall biosynthesis